MYLFTISNFPKVKFYNYYPKTDFITYCLQIEINKVIYKYLVKLSSYL